MLACAAAAQAQPLAGSLPIIKHPKFEPMAEYHAGMAAMADQKYAEAKTHFENVLSVSPGHPLTLYELGAAEAALGDLKAAAKDYQAALRAQPDMFEAVLGLAVADAQLGRADQARLQLVKLKHYQQTCAGACAQAGEIDAAITQVQSALPPAAP
jgi:tetratricopeptide (TPR) repeat protein